MRIRLIYDTDSGYEIKICAESDAEQAVVHLLAGLTNVTIERDSSIHDSYKLTKYIIIKGRRS